MKGHLRDTSKVAKRKLRASSRTEESDSETDSSAEETLFSSLRPRKKRKRNMEEMKLQAEQGATEEEEVNLEKGVDDSDLNEVLSKRVRDIFRRDNRTAESTLGAMEACLTPPMIVQALSWFVSSWLALCCAVNSNSQAPLYFTALPCLPRPVLTHLFAYATRTGP